MLFLQIRLFLRRSAGERSLADDLIANGIEPHVIGGADVAAN